MSINNIKKMVQARCRLASFLITNYSKITNIQGIEKVNEKAECKECALTTDYFFNYDNKKYCVKEFNQVSKGLVRFYKVLEV